jgi:cytochrome P450
VTQMTERALAPLEFDPYDHALQDDPYPVYARLRAESPLYRNTEHGFYVLSRHADITAALLSDEGYSNSMGVSLDASSWTPHAHLVMSFLAMDPPDHMRLRKLVSRGFTPKRVNQMRPQIERITRHYLDQLLCAGGEVSFDWIADVAGRIPMDVISEMLGVPESDRDEVRRLADLLVHREDGLRDVPAAGIEASMKLFEYYGEHVAQRHRTRTDDLTSALLDVEVGGDRMTDQEVIAFLFLMVVAGNETTTKLLGNSLFHLTARPHLLEQVFADESLVDDWVEETLRFDTSTQLLVRLLTQDQTFHGVTAPAGSQLVLALGSANRDERVFTDPGTFDLVRSPQERSKIMSFSSGRHFCLGSNLARLEARIVLTELVRGFSSVQVDHDRCVRFYSSNVRGFAQMPAMATVR